MLRKKHLKSERLPETRSTLKKNLGNAGSFTLLEEELNHVWDNFQMPSEGDSLLENKLLKRFNERLKLLKG